MKKESVAVVLAALLAVGLVTAAGYFTLATLDQKGRVGLTAKDSTTWEPVPGADGYVKYALTGQGELWLSVHVCGEMLEKDMFYQLTLNGFGGTDTDQSLASACDNPDGVADGFDHAYECGSWGDEGYYNFEMAVQAQPRCTGMTTCRWQDFVSDQPGLRCYPFFGRYRCIVCGCLAETYCVDGEYTVPLPTDGDGEVYRAKFVVKKAGLDPHGEDGSTTGWWVGVSFEDEALQFAIV
jgi:hypothetical protein